MSDSPEIAAILTTHNRAHLLPRVLDGLERQRLARHRYEILAVDDGSTDETQDILASYVHRLPLRIVRQAPSGLAAAKNLGIFMSRAPILLFLDDDDVADPGLLAAHLATHLRYPDATVAVLGFTDLDPTVASLPLMRLSFREFWGGRSSCKRSLLTQHGIFNPAFRFGCEDVELGWRLNASGLQVMYEPAARATMIRAMSFGDFCRRSIRQGRSQWLFASLHDAETVRDYCEIDQALAVWPQIMGDFAAFLRRAESLDRMMLRRGPDVPPLSAASQDELDEAYAWAFFLCRAKGITDAAGLPPQARRPQDFDVSRMAFLNGDGGVRRALIGLAAP
jgi:glycosyltransferase involved in cell wall biosynthesis